MKQLLSAREEGVFRFHGVLLSLDEVFGFRKLVQRWSLGVQFQASVMYEKTSLHRNVSEVAPPALSALEPFVFQFLG